MWAWLNWMIFLKSFWAQSKSFSFCAPNLLWIWQQAILIVDWPKIHCNLNCQVITLLKFSIAKKTYKWSPPPPGTWGGWLEIPPVKMKKQADEYTPVFQFCTWVYTSIKSIQNQAIVSTVNLQIFREGQDNLQSHLKNRQVGESNGHGRCLMGHNVSRPMQPGSIHKNKLC